VEGGLRALPPFREIPVTLTRKQLDKIRSSVVDRLDVVELLEELDLDGIRERTDEVNALCPFHDDRKQSFAINRHSGVFNCLACHAHGSIFDLYGRIKLLGYYDSLNDLAKFVGMPAVDKRRPIKESLVKRWHAQLKKNEERFEYFTEVRGISEDVIDEFMLGFDGERITIPIRDAQGRLRNVRRYLPNAGDKPKILSYRNGDQTYGENRLLNITVLDETEIVWAEGEMDCLLLWTQGFPALTPTVGAGGIHDDWIEWFRGKTVYLLPDLDKAGIEGATKIAARLGKVATVKVVTWPKDVGKGGDATDFFMKREYSPDVLDDLMANAPLHEEARPIDLTDEEKKDAKESPEIDLWDATLAENVRRTFTTTAMVSAKTRSPFLCPRRVTYTCDEGVGKICSGCEVSKLHGGRVEKVVQADDPIILQLINCTANQRDIALRKLGGCGLNCRTVQIQDDLEDMNVEEVYLIPHVDIFSRSEERHEYVNRRAFVIGHGIQGQRVYKFHGYTHPDPKTQEAVHVFASWDETEDSVSHFKLTANDKKRLRRFRPKEWTEVAIEKQWQRVYRDFERNVHGLVQRMDMQVIMDLVWHAPLSFHWMGKLEPKGFVEGLVIGDTGQAKSEMSKILRQHYRLGDRIQGEQTSNAGLVGGLEKFGDKWVVTWGKIPLNDGRLLVIDEFSGITPEQIAKMSDLRSTGIAEIDKIRGDKTSARTRLLLCTNPREKRSLSTYNTAIEAVMGLFEQPEDVRRTDIAIAVSSEQVASVDYESARVSGKKPYFDTDRCRDLVLWAWSRTPDQVVFTKRAEKMILEQSTLMGEKYSAKIPLVNASDQRLKLAKLSAACAARFFSTDKTGARLIVKRAHVEWIVKFLNRIYDDTLQYDEFSSRIQDEEVVRPEDAERLKEEFRGLPHAKRLADRMMRTRLVSYSAIENLMGIERDEMKEMLSWLLDNHLVKPLQSQIAKTSKFVALCRMLQKEDIWFEEESVSIEGTNDHR